LAKELVQSKKAKKRMTISKAQINSVILQLTQQLGQIKVVGAFQKSGEILKIMNSLSKVEGILLV
jgi:charged multivesicular body protein 3